MIFLLWQASAGAIEVAGARFEDSVQVEKETLVLNGAGLRTATIFKVKVYAAALYLKTRTSDAGAALAAAPPKQIRMQFLREVSGDEIGKAWDHSFRENCELACDSQAEALEKLKTLMTTVKAGDRMTYTFFENRVEVAIGNEKKGEIASTTFPRNLLATWIGKAPPTEELRRGLLGQKR